MTPQIHITDSARQEIALRDALAAGNRHTRRRAKKLLRDIPPPQPWFVFDHEVHGTVAIRPAPDGRGCELKTFAGLSDDAKREVARWAFEQLNSQPAQVSE